MWVTEQMGRPNVMLTLTSHVSTLLNYNTVSTIEHGFLHRSIARFNRHRYLEGTCSGLSHLRTCSYLQLQSDVPFSPRQICHVQLFLCGAKDTGLYRPLPTEGENIQEVQLAHLFTVFIELASFEYHC